MIPSVQIRTTLGPLLWVLWTSCLKRTRIDQQTLSSLAQAKVLVLHPKSSVAHPLSQLVNGYLNLDLCSVAKTTRIQTDAFPKAKGFWRQPAKQARLVATACLNTSLTLSAKLHSQTLLWDTLIMGISASDSQGTDLQTWHMSSCTELVSSSMKYAQEINQ